MAYQDSNEVIVYKPRICVCPRECCTQEESLHVSSTAEALDADVCCDSSDACCKQACCQSDVQLVLSECASDGCKDDCCAGSESEDRCSYTNESCCEDECCGGKPQLVTPADTLVGDTCCDDCEKPTNINKAEEVTQCCTDCYDCEKPSNSNNKTILNGAKVVTRCCDDDYDCEKLNVKPAISSQVNILDKEIVPCCNDNYDCEAPSKKSTVALVPTRPALGCTSGCCESTKQVKPPVISSCCEDKECSAETTSNKCCEKICCGTDFCQCKPVDDSLPVCLDLKVGKFRDNQPGGGCNGPGKKECAGGCCEDQVAKERLLAKPRDNVEEDCSCCDSEEVKEDSCADGCCSGDRQISKPSPCGDGCCDKSCNDSASKADSCCADSCCDNDQAPEPEIRVTINTDDANIQKVVLSIKGMTCAGCVATAERRLKATPGIESYKISLITTKAEIFYDKQRLTPQDIIDAVNALSFTATLESTALRVNMTCDAIEISLQELSEIVRTVDGVDSVVVNESAPESCWMPKQSATDSVTVSYDPATVGIRDLLTKVQVSVESAQLVEVKQENKMQHEVTSGLWRFLVCLFLTVPVVVTAFLLPTSPISDAAINTPIVNGLTVKIFIEWVLVTPIQVLLCGPLYSSAWSSIRYAKFANVDLLISISTTVAYLYSVIVGLILAIDPSLVNGDTYFETSALIMTFILLGRYLEVLAKSKTYTVLDSLNKHHKGESLLVEGDVSEANTRTIPNSLIQRKDILKVLPGDRVPTDGVIVEGTTEVDESMLTGEARPQFKQKGDIVFGGTINRHAPILVQCTKVPGETTSDMIYQLVEQTQMTKAKIENITDKVSKIFVPVIVSAAVAVFLIWIVLASTGVVVADPSLFPFSLNFALAVLIVSCPCAVGLAVPTATMVGTGVAAKRGILFKGSQIIETLSKARTFCFDKTGTLTTGELTVAEVVVLDKEMTQKEVLFYAASIERDSNHPIARAIVSNAESHGITSTEPKKTQVKPGLGVVGVVDGRTVQLGNSEFLSSESRATLEAYSRQVEDWLQQGCTVIYLALDDQLCGILVLTDTLKPSAKTAIDYLTSRGHEVWVISGDHPTTVRAIAAQLNIPADHVLGGVLPRDKQNKIKELRNHDEVVMIGDGMNDGPALAAASVGVALGSTSSHLAQYAAGVVILNDSLISVLTAVDLAKRITGRIKLNLVWAFVYNTLFIPLAAGALWVPFAFTIPPPFAGLSELVSSVPVVIFSLLLRTYKPPSFK